MSLTNVQRLDLDGSWSDLTGSWQGLQLANFRQSEGHDQFPNQAGKKPTHTCIHYKMSVPLKLNSFHDAFLSNH
jgi:hypothetical protein